MRHSLYIYIKMLASGKGLFLLLFLVAALLAGCHHDESKEAPAPEQQNGRTVIVYMVAENSLGGYGFHKSDSLEIVNARQSISADDRMLVFIDAGGSPTLYRVRADKEEPEVVMRWQNDFCSTDPARLQEVLDTAQSRCPNKEYALVMWSHADGWIAPTNTDYAAYEQGAESAAAAQRPFSFGIDSGTNGRYKDNGAQMSVEGMASAIEGAGLHLKYVFFDACLMGNIEVAYDLRHVADYVIASPAQTPGAGSYYTNQVKKAFFSADPSDICRTYLEDVESEELKASYQGIGLVMACIETGKLQALAEALSDALPYSALAGHGAVEMDTVITYQAYSSSYYYRPHNYDALQALRHILPAEYLNRAVAALNAAVVYRCGTESVWIGPGLWNYQDLPIASGDYCGVSLFVPQEVYTKNASRSRHGDLNAAFRETAWYSAAGFAATGW